MPALRIILELKGCANRPFYHFMAARLPHRGADPESLEQIGSYDPMPNEHGEKLVSLNYDRLNYWIGQGAFPSTGAGELLGLAGYTSLHPYTYKRAWDKRRKARRQETADAEAEKLEANS